MLQRTKCLGQKKSNAFASWITFRFAQTGLYFYFIFYPHLQSALFSSIPFFLFPLIPFSPLLSNLSLFKLLFFSSFNRCKSVSATWKLLYPWLEREREWGCIVSATTSQGRQTFKPTTVIGGRDVCFCCVNHFFFHWLDFCILLIWPHWARRAKSRKLYHKYYV